MRTHVAEATIDRPAEQIWAYAAEIPRHREWMSVSDARTVRGQGTRVGDRGVERLDLGPAKRDLEFEVIAAEPGRRLLWRALAGQGIELEVELTLEPSGPTSALARYRGSYTLHGRWRLLAPILAMEGAGGIRRELGRLKTNVEAGAPPPAAIGLAEGGPR
jgi:uncharacterized membrane protein